jgi:transcriptional regulator with XRE-family HTH domain
MVETGKRMPSPDTLQILARVFHKDVRWFLDENPEVEWCRRARTRRTRSDSARAGVSVLA